MMTTRGASDTNETKGYKMTTGRERERKKEKK